MPDISRSLRRSAKELQQTYQASYSCSTQWLQCNYVVSMWLYISWLYISI